MTHRREVLAELVQQHGWRIGAELGVLKGDTFLYLLERCPALALVGVDRWLPLPAYKPTSRPRSAEEMAGYEVRVRAGAAQYGARAALVKRPTVEAAELYPDGHFDFVFIDADHHEAAVRADIEAWRPKVHAGGWLMGHDYGGRQFPGVAAAVHALLGQPEVFPDKVWAVPC